MQRELRLYSASYPGHISLLIEAEVTEQSSVGGAVTGSNSATLDTQRLTYDPPFDQDRARCKAAWAVLTKRLTEIIHLPLWTTLPDPPPNIVEAAVTLEALYEQLESLKAKHPDKADEVINGLARTLRVSPQFLSRSHKNS